MSPLAKCKSLDCLGKVALKSLPVRVWLLTSPHLLPLLLFFLLLTFLCDNPLSSLFSFPECVFDLVFFASCASPHHHSQAGDRSMPHQPTIVGFPRRCSSDLTGDDIQRRKGEKVSNYLLCRWETQILSGRGIFFGAIYQPLQWELILMVEFYYVKNKSSFYKIVRLKNNSFVTL